MLVDTSTQVRIMGGVSEKSILEIHTNIGGFPVRPMLGAEHNNLSLVGVHLHPKVATELIKAGDKALEFMGGGCHG